MKRLAAFLLVAFMALPGVASAQEQVDVTKLGVSLDRIKRELRQAEASEQTEGGPLKLQIHVEVFGRAPKIDFLEGFSPSGPLPYGSPTHREVLDVITPQQFRAPVMQFSSVVYWATQKLWERSRKSRCEQEIAEYRALVMQGVAVAAPRCTQ